MENLPRATLVFRHIYNLMICPENLKATHSACYFFCHAYFKDSSCYAQEIFIKYCDCRHLKSGRYFILETRRMKLILYFTKWKHSRNKTGGQRVVKLLHSDKDCI